MRDARLREIEFLTAVERGTVTSLTIAKGSTEQLFGSDAETFRTMVAHLIMTGKLNGPSLESFPNIHLPQPSAALATVEHTKSRDVFWVLIGHTVDLRMSHGGLIRLVELREALDRSRIRDPFGILFDQRYRERDLFVRLLDAAPATPLSLIALDLDNFKAVNDEHGHDAGDLVLKGCFRRVLDTIGDLGEAYRRGGDEAVVFLPGTALAVAEALAEKLRAGFEEEFRVAYAGVNPTLSVGVSEVVERADVAAVSKHVDDLAYKAKKGGRNRVVARRFPT